MVVNTIKELGIEDKVTFMNTLENPEYAQKHIQTTGRSTVPCLYIDDKPMFESRDINQWFITNASKI